MKMFKLKDLLRRAIRIFHRPPDFIIGKPDQPYLLRWWVIPRNYYFNIYLHKILRSDDDRGLHDHPWNNCSVVLRGRYTEVMLDPTIRNKWWLHLGAQYHEEAQKQSEEGCQIQYALALYTTHGLPQVRFVRRPGSVIFRRATTPHRLEVSTDKPVWTLFFTGPVFRKWGFHLKIWTYYLKVVKPDSPGEWKND